MPSATLVSSPLDDIPSSLEHVKSSDAFPKQHPQRVSSLGELEPVTASGSNVLQNNALNESFICTFPLLPGESVSKWGRIGQNGTLYATNYRLFVHLGEQNGFHTVPLLSIESVEPKDIVNLVVYCKDGRVLKIALENGQSCLSWYRELCSTINRKREDIFAFAFYAWCTEERRELSLSLQSMSVYSNGPNVKLAEFHRLGFDDTVWRVTDVNSQFECCDSYPTHWIIPVWLTDKEILECAKARFFRRVPAVVWRHREKGSVLMRSSQPSVGIFGWRYPMDERLLQSVLRATTMQPRAHKSQYQNGHVQNGDAQLLESSLIGIKPMLIVDARSYAAAWANRAKGGGFESQECYQHSEVQFMGLANIHNIRYSFQQLRTLLAAPPNNDNWLQNLQSTQWMQNLSNLLSSAMRVVEALEQDGRSVLVHCSDGWDRTAQIVSLAKLLLDSYYRTMKGFKELVQREWIDFGHKFSDRFGLLNQDPNERSPVFLQWLDCVHQLQQQFPCAFEFNPIYLVKLAQHAYSGLFGTFLWNSAKEAFESSGQGRSSCSFSVWSYLHPDNCQFRNYAYECSMDALWPEYQVQDMRLWRAMYCLAAHPAGSQSAHRLRSESRSGAMERSLTRAHSCDSLTSAGEVGTMQNSLVRTGSDSNLIQTKVDQQPPTRSAEDVSFVLDELIAKVSLSSDVDEKRNETILIPNMMNGNVNSEPDSNIGDYSLCTDGRTDSNGLWQLSKTLTNGDFVFESNCRNEMKTSTSEISDPTVNRPYMNSSRSQSKDRLNGYRLLDSGIDRSVMNKSKTVKKRKRPHSITDFLDTDGLTKLSDPVQDRMRKISDRHQKKLELCEQEILNLRCRPQQSMPCQKCCNRLSAENDEVNGDLSFEPHSFDSTGGASDVSWETVEDGDTQPTKWVPDHLVTYCMGCDNKFSAINRKHHCRSCGKIFCYICTQFEMDVPEEQLYHPVRVCRQCYDSLRCRKQPNLVVTTLQTNGLIGPNS